MRLISKDDLDDVQLALLEARFRRLGWVRPILIAAMSTLVLLTLVGDHAAWRRWTLGILCGGALVRSLYDVRCKRRLSRELSSSFAWASAAIASGVFFLATGGFDSPLLPTVIMACFFVGTLAPRRNLVRLTLAFAAVICGLAVVSHQALVPNLMPALFGGGPHLPQPAVLLYARVGALLLALAWAAFASSAVREIFRKIVGDAFDARDEVLRSHDAHTRELTALTGELAHELKNPLANIKGLAVLVDREVTGKAAERLGVLQGEVNRMEEILRGFLTFSRPLVPLSQEEVDLQELCRSVLTLHEGIAHARSVSLEMRAGRPLPASCDPRKVKQILINLVQNAIEASPPGASVELAVHTSAGGARVEVHDHGPGVSAALADHLFEPGLTSKKTGSGLGLAVARNLARQHGGEVTLHNRSGGGCLAALELPVKTATMAETAT